ncbi:glucoamylase family protein, partial [Escherichia coli]|uniref:glucoamylase family protein n=1 Tax=Escherichia coli TaxID=562 RepID=UPI003CE51919
NEKEIRTLADALYNRVEWDWLLVRTSEQNPNIGCLLHGWIPETGFIKNVYKGYSEALLLYILAMGSPTHPVPQSTWETFIGGAKTETF